MFTSNSNRFLSSILKIFGIFPFAESDNECKVSLLLSMYNFAVLTTLTCVIFYRSFYYINSQEDDSLTLTSAKAVLLLWSPTLIFCYSGLFFNRFKLAALLNKIKRMEYQLLLRVSKTENYHKLNNFLCTMLIAETINALIFWVLLADYAQQNLKSVLSAAEFFIVHYEWLLSFLFAFHISKIYQIFLLVHTYEKKLLQDSRFYKLRCRFHPMLVQVTSSKMSIPSVVHFRKLHSAVSDLADELNSSLSFIGFMGVLCEFISFFFTIIRLIVEKNFHTTYWILFNMEKLCLMLYATTATKYQVICLFDCLSI